MKLMTDRVAYSVGRGEKLTKNVMVANKTRAEMICPGSAIAIARKAPAWRYNVADTSSNPALAVL